MITLIVGNKGSGKTKKLINFTNEAVEKSNGNVVVLDKGTKLYYDITHSARLIDVDEYAVAGFESLYGFLSGICACNYDVTDILIDSTFKICGRDFDKFSDFVVKVNEISSKTSTNFYMLISASREDFSLPEGLNVDIINL